VAARVGPLSGKSLRAYNLARAPINIYEGSVRSSKTVGSLIRWIDFVRTAPAGPLLLSGKTERTARRNVIDPLIDMLGPRRARYNVGTGELMMLDRKVYVAGANDERSQDKIRGVTLAGAYADEISTYPESFFQMLTTRFSVDGAMLFGTTNPEGPRHWLKLNWLDRACLWLRGDGTIATTAPGAALDGTGALRLHRFSFRLADNPYLPAGYLDMVLRQYTGLWRRRYIDGEWVAADGIIYDAFDYERHVVQHLPPILKFFALGIDYGTSAPFAALLLGHGADNRIYVCGEYRYESSVHRRTKTDAEYSAELSAWLDAFAVPQSDPPVRGVRPQWTAVDPSAASFVTQLYRDGRLTPTAADNSVIDGIRQVGMLIAQDRLRVHASCTGLLSELPGYVWDPKATEKGDDKPLKDADHSCDALRYGIATTQLAWRPILAQPIRDDYAPTRDGWTDPVLRRH
jgi:PBSX family phage terminase large subunit